MRKAQTIFNHSATSFDPQNYELAIKNYNLYKEVMKVADPSSEFGDKDIMFDLALATTYGRIAEEDTKFGLLFTEIEEILSSKELEALENISITGLMGMATFTDNTEQVKGEFTKINTLFKKLKTDNKEFTTLSIGMSGDYKLAIECGSTMVRVGSAIFGTRN